MKADSAEHKASYEFNMKYDKHCPLPKGDKMYYFGQGNMVSRKDYPDQPREVQKMQDKNVKAVNSGDYSGRN